MPAITALLTNPSKKEKHTVNINLPDQLYSYLTDKNYTIEIVQLFDHCHSIYVCEKDADIISASFNPQFRDAIKIAFKKIHDKLLPVEDKI